LNLGLRWEFISVPKEENGLLTLRVGNGLDVLKRVSSGDPATTK